MLTAFALAAAMTLNEPCGSMGFHDDMDKVTLYRVKAPGKTRFLSNYAPDGSDCSDDKPCAIKAYLVTGDLVAVSHQRKGLACAWFKPSPKHLPRGKRETDPIKVEGPSTLAWLPMAALEPVEVPAKPPGSSWNGEWVGESQLLDLTPQGEGRLKIKGDAVYARDAEAVEIGGVNVGEIDGLYFRDGDSAEGATEFDGVVRRPRATDYGVGSTVCALKLRLVGGYLLAHDNQKCGGMNVSFTGVYRRDPAP